MRQRFLTIAGLKKMKMKSSYGQDLQKTWGCWQIVQRVYGGAGAVENPSGRMALYEDMDQTGIENFSKEDFTKIITIDRDPLKQELLCHEELYAKFYDRLP